MSGLARIDHLVVLADTLEQGAAWCESTLGVAPGPGGEHPLMGTHNRLLRLASVDHPLAYFEVIARNPAAPGPQAGRRRWFDMDEPRVQSTIRDHGPRLAHWVARVPDVKAAVAALARLGIDCGEVVEASRMTPRGLLKWQSTIRPDGQRQFDGCLPMLIEWGEVHPAATLADAGVTLRSLALAHPQAVQLRRALDAIGLDGLHVEDGGPASVCATLLTPRGQLRLESRGI
ncbi:VOC family protein [Ramlibacter henchirensis]|uniref:VOC family protein n=1 Tax=Ramlibacter henchirensis TaxID=204072 RepID=A0A4Z0C733_9BURK|nr:VOC family protein [Ramlibacter henchirensis]TFZ07091.1 VOC family protein [Ramlibacter henchirensis]